MFILRSITKKSHLINWKVNRSIHTSCVALKLYETTLSKTGKINLKLIYLNEYFKHHNRN